MRSAATRAEHRRGIDHIEGLAADDGVAGTGLVGKDLDEDQAVALAVLLGDAALLADECSCSSPPEDNIALLELGGRHLGRELRFRDTLILQEF
jgi:hypothetical protein